jgi:hypothetical protein
VEASQVLIWTHRTSSGSRLGRDAVERIKQPVETCPRDQDTFVAVPCSRTRVPRCASATCPKFSF